MRQKNYFIKFHQNSYKNIFACTEIQYLLLNYQFKRNCSNLYTFDLISSEMSKVKFSKLRLKSNDKNQNIKGMLKNMTYHPLLKSLSAIIDTNLSILYMDKEVRKVFNPRPMVSFRSARKSNSYLVRAKLYPLDRIVCSYKCKSKRCQVCNNIKEADSFICSN